MFVDGSPNVIYGSPGAGKSWLAMHMAIAMTHGAPLYGPYTANLRDVLFIDAELTPNIMQQRWNLAFTQWAETTTDTDNKKLTVIPYLQFEEECKIPLNLLRHDTRTALDALIEEHDVVILDNWSMLTERGAGMNGVRDDEDAWRKVFKWLRAWGTKGKTFIIVMHPTKSGQLAGTHLIGAFVWTLLELFKVPVEWKADENNVSFMITMPKGRNVIDKYQAPMAMEVLSPKQVAVIPRKSPFMEIKIPVTAEKKVHQF